MKTKEELVWEVVLTLIPVWKGTSKDLFDSANKIAYEYLMWVNGELK